MQLERCVQRGMRLMPTVKLTGSPFQKAEGVSWPVSKRPLTTRCPEVPNLPSWRPEPRKSRIPTVSTAIALTISGAAAFGTYSLLSEEEPSPPVEADPSKQRLVILGMERRLE